MSRKGGGEGGATPLYYIKKVVKRQTLNALLASAESGKGRNDKMAHNFRKKGEKGSMRKKRQSPQAGKRYKSDPSITLKKQIKNSLAPSPLHGGGAGRLKWQIMRKKS